MSDLTAETVEYPTESFALPDEDTLPISSVSQTPIYRWLRGETDASVRLEMAKEQIGRGLDIVLQDTNRALADLCSGRNTLKNILEEPGTAEDPELQEKTQSLLITVNELIEALNRSKESSWNGYPVPAGLEIEEEALEQRQTRLGQLLQTLKPIQAFGIVIPEY